MYSNNINKIYLTNVFIIDWDDTLFPTSWVNKNNIKINDESIKNYKLYFLELDKTITNLLESLDKVGDVYIVTNASISWIKSCLTILNITRQFIIRHNIRIVSARDIYANKTISPTEWKILTFKNIIHGIVDKINKNLKPNTIFNIISIGDAMYEYVALIKLNGFFNSYVQARNRDKKFNISYNLKSIKFIEKPDFDYVIDQIQILQKNKDDIINRMGFVDIKFE
jgi:hypothetical protein